MTFKVKKPKRTGEIKLTHLGRIEVTPEQKKRTFHLPIEQTIYVPSTSGVKTQRKLSKKEMDARVTEVRKYLSNKFGGYTSVKSTGGFVLRNGKVVKEDVVKVTAFATKSDFNKNEQDVYKKVGEWGKKWKQESVSYETEGDLFIIEPKK